MRMDETGSYRILTDYGYYGFQINTDGLCQLAEKDIETFTVTTTSETPLFTITSKWAGHRVSEYPKKDGSLLVMIQRGEEKIIPNGNTILKEGDVLVLLKRDVAVV